MDKKNLLVFAAFFVLSLPAFALDVNNVTVGPSGGVVSGGDFVVWTSIGDPAAGTTTSDDYTINLGFDFDNIAPVTGSNFISGTYVTDTNTQFSCTDDSSGCKVFTYTLDTTTNYRLWGSPDANIGVLITADQDHSLEFYSTDVMDNNEGAESQSAPRYDPPSTGSPTPPGGTSPTATETVEVITVEGEYEQLADPSIPILDQTDEDLDMEDQRFAETEEVELERKMKVFADKIGGTTSIYRAIFTMIIQNSGNKPLLGVGIIEGIPKEIAEDASWISSDIQFEIIDADPVLKFFVGDLEPGESETVEYTVTRTGADGPITEEMFNDLKSPAAIVLLSAEDRCLNVRCDDFSPCTRDYCVAGTCIHAPMNYGATCNTGMICDEGECVQEPAPPVIVIPPVTPAGPDYSGIVLVVGAILFIVVAAITGKKFMEKKKKAN